MTLFTHRVFRRMVAVAAILALSVAWAGSLHAREFKKLPWHLMDYRYEFPQALPFSTLAITLDVKADPDPGEFFYLCALWGYIGETSFYLGLQTDVHQGLGTKGYTGPGLIFTRWGSGDPADTRPAADGWVVPPGPHTPDEGLSVSIRRLLPWGDGRYTFILQRRPGTDLPLSSWIDLMVFDHQRGQWIDGGGLRFPTASPALARRPVTFAELYGRGKFASPDSQAQGFDPITLTLHPLMVDGKFVPPLGKVVQPKDVPGSITQRTSITPEGQAVVISIQPEPKP